MHSPADSNHNIVMLRDGTNKCWKRQDKDLGHFLKAMTDFLKFKLCTYTENIYTAIWILLGIHLGTP